MANPKICAVADCDKPVKQKGMCRSHYMRMWRYGSTESRQWQPVVIPWVERRVAYQGDDCLPWPFSRNPDGYGTIFFPLRKTSTIASRLMCQMAHGEPPGDGLYQAAHSCGNGHLGCVNPRHLSWKTPVENGADKRAHREQRRLLP